MTTTQVEEVQARVRECSDLATLQAIIAELLTQIPAEPREDIYAEWWRSDQQYRYRIVARNGITVSGPEDRYTQKKHMMKMIEMLYGKMEIRKVDPPGRAL
jgi:hypothetical protein